MFNKLIENLINNVYVMVTITVAYNTILFMMLDWSDILVLQIIGYCIITLTALALCTSQYLRLVQPVMWIRHYTTKANIESIIENGFKEDTNERSMEIELGGQMGQLWISGSIMFDSAFKRMLDSYYENEECGYLYIKVPVFKSEIQKATITSFFSWNNRTFGNGIELSATIRDANIALKEGNYSLEEPNGFKTIFKTVVLTLASQGVYRPISDYIKMAKSKSSII